MQTFCEYVTNRDAIWWQNNGSNNGHYLWLKIVGIHPSAIAQKNAIYVGKIIIKNIFLKIIMNLQGDNGSQYSLAFPDLRTQLMVDDGHEISRNIWLSLSK